jgi:hypothetical protein
MPPVKATSSSQIPPLPRVPGVAPPFVGHADAAGEGDVLVADEGLAVAAVIGLPELRLVHGPEPLDLGAGRRHAVHQAAVHAERPEGVEDDTDPQAGAGPLGEQLGHLPADGALPVDEGEEVDGRGGRGHRLEHGREDPVAVAQHLDRVALGRRHAEQALEGAPEMQVIGHPGQRRRAWPRPGRAT